MATDNGIEELDNLPNIFSDMIRVMLDNMSGEDFENFYNIMTENMEPEDINKLDKILDRLIENEFEN
jgi:hypothetical protein